MKKEGIVEIGKPVREGMVQSAVTGYGPDGKLNIVYMGVGQWENPNILLAYNVDTKETKQYSIDSSCTNDKDIMGAWGIFSASDKNIYVGTYFGGHLLKFDTKKCEYTDLGNIYEGEQYIYSFAEDEDRNLYASVYPGGSIVKFNIDTLEKELIGPFDNDIKYARSAVSFNNRIFCVLGTAKTKIAVYDPISGNSRTYDYPGYEASADIVLLKRKGRLYGFNVLTKDTKIFENEGFLPCDVPEIECDLQSIFDNANEVFAKTAALKSKSTFRWYQTFPEEPEIMTNNRKLIGITDSKIYLMKEDGETEVHEFKYESEGAIMFMIDKGPDDIIYGSSMLPLRIFSFDPGKSILKNLGNPISVNAQIYSLAVKDDLMYFASYPGAVISVYDAGKPWKKNINPRVIGRIGHNQCRPPAMVLGEDDMVYIVSVADYGMQGGALTRYDPVRNEFRVWENIAGVQSLKTLVNISGTGLLALGTSNETGGGAPKIDEVPFVLIFDTVKEEVIGRIDPDMGKFREFSSLRCYDNRLYAITDNGILFIYNLSKSEFVLKKKLPVEKVIMNGMDTNGKKIYGTGGGKLFSYDPSNNDFNILAEVNGWTNGFLLLKDRIYGTPGTHLVYYSI